MQTNNLNNVSRVPISVKGLETLKADIDEAVKLITLEADGKSFDDFYTLCFSRLIRTDPYSYTDIKMSESDSVLMLGTDQRDFFVPYLIGEANYLSKESRIFDIGSGDGQTSKYLLEEISEQQNISILDTNTHYLSAYENLAHKLGHKIDDCFIEPLDQYIENAVLQGQYNLALLIHAIYFSKSPDDFLNHVLDAAVKGGRIFIVFADELDGYTGKLITSKLRDGAVTSEYVSAIERRHNVFGIQRKDVSVQSTQSAFQAKLRRNDFRIHVAERQPSRIYGNTLSDIIAAAFITTLYQVDDSSVEEKIIFVAQQIIDNPTYFDLSVESKGRRKGMLSVTQPQYLFIVEKI